MLQGFPAFITSGTMFEAEAQRFIELVGITDSLHKTAINTLVKAAKTNGWWNECTAIYPIIGGTAATHKWNLKDVRDSNEAFRITFGSGWTHASTGATPDGTANGYGDTHLSPAETLTIDDSHISLYTRTGSGADNQTDMGCFIDSPISNFLMYVDRNASGGCVMDQYSYVGERIVATSTGATGYFMSTRTGNTVFKAFKNGSQYGSTNSTARTALMPNGVSMYLGGTHRKGVGLFVPSTKQIAFATIGAGISDALAATMYTDIQNYQTILGRNV